MLHETFEHHSLQAQSKEIDGPVYVDHDQNSLLKTKFYIGITYPPEVLHELQSPLAQVDNSNGIQGEHVVEAHTI